MGYATCLFDTLPDTAVVLVTTGTLVMVAFLRWIGRQSSFIGKPQFLLAGYGLSWWLLVAGLELQSASADCKTFFALAAWPGIILVSMAWLAFILSFAWRSKQKPLRRDLGWILPLVIIGTLAAWTTPWHGLFYIGETRLVIRDGRVSGAFEHGPLFFLVAALNYASVLGALVVVLRAMRRVSRVYLRFFNLFLLFSAAPILANISYIVFDRTLFGFDPTPFTFIFVLIGLGALIFNDRFFDIVAVGREVLYFQMPSPVFILDPAGVVKGANPAASALVESKAIVGTRLADLAPFRAFANLDEIKDLKDVPHRITIDERYFDVRVSPVTSPVGRTDKLIAAVLLLTDISDLYSRGKALAGAVDIMRDTLNQNIRQIEEIRTLRDKAEKMADTDWLTGLLNRRRLEDHFAELVAAMQDGEQVVLTVVDIDHFKMINDRFGHAIGDRVLKAFAQRLRDCLGDDRILFRVGGEEFVILGRAPSLATTRSELERLRKSLTEKPLMRQNDHPPVTISGGIAAYPRDGQTVDALYAHADKHLYAAKESGRNRILPQGPGDAAD